MCDDHVLPNGTCTSVWKTGGERTVKVEGAIKARLEILEGISREVKGFMTGGEMRYVRADH
jgi:hypothetical protein